MKALLSVMLAGAVFLFSGCGKKSVAKVSADQSAPEQVQSKSPEPMAASAPRVMPVAVADNADASAQLAQLTELVRRFGMEQQRVPHTLDDLVAARYLAGLPAAPAGKHFVIDAKHMQVVLE